MRTFAARVQLLAALLGVTAALALGMVGTASPRTAAAQKEQPPKKDPLLPTGSDDLISDSSGCVTCHGYSTQTAATSPWAMGFKSDKFALLTESVIWKEADAHAIAFKVLEQPDGLGQQMAQKLKYDVTKSVACLTCHAIDLAPGTPLPAVTDTVAVKDRFDTGGGVNCNLCHGIRKPWQTEHAAPKMGTIPWRTYTPEKKEQYGMRNLRDPVVKAQLCVSCHIGNPAEGKVVTHEMYAAGHPPLPPFELASYMEGEPKHWAYPTDPKLTYFADEKQLPAEQRWKLFRFHPAKDEAYLARHAAVGAITAMKAEAQMLQADAEAALKGGDGIDFARFDCYACHHDLKFPSDRQKRGYAGPPGRPTLRAAVGVPASVYARHAAGIKAGELGAKAAGFDEKWAELQKAALARPFGDPAKVRDAAKAVTEWCDGFLKVQCECDKPLYSKDQADDLRKQLADAATSNAAVADPEAAMCLAWAYVTLSKEAGKTFAPGSEDRLKDVIPLNVRVKEFSKEVVENGTKRMAPVPAQFAERMKAVNAYDAARFTEVFRLLPHK